MIRGSPAATVPATVATRPSAPAGQREQRREGAGVGRLALDDGDPAGLGQGAGVDEVDPLGRRRLEQAAQDRRGQRRAVVLGELAGDLERQGLDPAPRELGEEPPEDLGQRQVRGDRPGRLGRQQRCVDRVAGAATGEDVEDLGRDLLGDEDLGLGGRRTEMWRQQRVRRVEQRRTGRWLVLEDVDAGTAEMAGSKRLGDGRLVDDAAAGDVEHDRARA